jgi:hypothetical protein
MNELATVGHNRGLAFAIPQEEDLPAQVVAYLGEEFARLPNRVTELLDKAREVPKVIEDDSAMGECAKVIKELRDLSKELESHRESEKAPYLRSSQSVDNWFWALRDKCMKRGKTDKPGAADILQDRLDNYNQRKLRAEQEKRRLEAEAARKEAEDRARAEADARRKAEDDRIAAERARKPETQAGKGAVADLSAAQLTAATIESDLAREKAQEAHIATLAKPADLVRTRVEEGPVVTMAREPYALIEDESLLDRHALWPFISLEAKEKALRAWAKNAGYNIPMAGASIGYRTKSVVR